MDGAGQFLPGVLAPPIKGLDEILHDSKWPSFRSEILLAQERSVAAMQSPDGCAPPPPPLPHPTSVGPDGEGKGSSSHRRDHGVVSSVDSVAHLRPFSARFSGSHVQQLAQVLAEWRGEVPGQGGVSVAAEWALRATSEGACGQCRACKKQYSTYSALPLRMEALIAEGHSQAAVEEAFGGVMSTLGLSVADMRDAVVSTLLCLAHVHQWC